MPNRLQKKQNLLRQLNLHFPEWSPEVFNAINTKQLKNHHIGCALSHRTVIQEAKDKKYKNILVFEEDALLRKNFRELFLQNIKELAYTPWDILYLGSCVWEPKPPKKPRTFESAPNCDYLKFLTRSTCTHSLAYNNSCYNYILNSWPDNIDDMQKWCKKHKALDQWLMHKMQGIGSVKDGYRKFSCLTTTPRLCSQPFLVGDNKQDDPKMFYDKRAI